MEAKSNIPGHQDAKFAFKFISEERLNYFTQRVHYDQKKKLEDEAWFNYLARKDKSKVKNMKKNPQPSISHLEVTNVMDTKQNELKRSDEIPSTPNVSHSESNGHSLYVFSPIPKVPSFNENSSTRIGDGALAVINKTQMILLDTQLDSNCYHDQNEEISFLVNTDADSGERFWDHSATNLQNVEVASTMTLNGVTHTTLKHPSANERRTKDYVVIHEDPTQAERLLHETNHVICTINKAGLAQLKVLWLKILLHLDGILALYVKAPEQENSEEYLLRQMRAAEFTALFARNYVYSLRRKIQELHELVNAVTTARQNTRSANKIHISLVAAHQAASKALITYLKQMPYPVGVGVPDKLIELLHLIIDMCAMCSLFGIDSAELKTGPDEVENKCRYMLIQIQDQKNQRRLSIDEQHSKVLPLDNKKISCQKHKKKIKHYSLAMYKPTVPLKAIPKGYKNKIKNLAKVKFGPIPKIHSEAQELQTVAEHKSKRHHTRVSSPKRMQKTAKAKKPHRPMKPSHDNKIEWVGKFDDSDNILTLVELLGQKEVANDPEETHMPYADMMTEKEKEVNQVRYL